MLKEVHDNLSGEFNNFSAIEEKNSRAYRSQSRSLSFFAKSAAVESCLLGINEYQSINQSIISQSVS